MTQLLLFHSFHWFMGVCACWSLSVHKDAISKGWPLPWKASVGRGTPRFCRHPTKLFAGTQQGKLASLQRLTICSLLKFLCLCQTATKEKKNDCCLKDPIGVPYCRSDPRQPFTRTAVICFLSVMHSSSCISTQWHITWNFGFKFHVPPGGLKTRPNWPR